MFLLGASHKRRTQSGGYSVRTMGVLHMWTSTLFGAKNFGFFKIYGVSARKR